MKKKLIYELDNSGHHLGYLENLILDASNADCNIILLCTRAIKNNLLKSNISIPSNFEIIALHESEENHIFSYKFFLKKSLAELSLIKKYLAEYRINELFFMHINPFQIALLLWPFAYSSKIAISGILFNPVIPFSRIYSFKEKLCLILPTLRKRLQLYLLSKNKYVKKIYILNDAENASILNRVFKKKNFFASVVDPYPLSLLGNNFGNHLSHEDRDKNSSYIFLLPGAISPRKNCLTIMDALESLSHSLVQSIELRIVGKVSESNVDYKKRIILRLNQINQQSKLLKVIFIDEHLSNSAFLEEFKRASGIIALYKKFYGSSGIIGNACHFSKPLLVNKSGLAGSIVSSKNLGICVDVNNVGEIKKSLYRMITGDLLYCKKEAKKYFLSSCNSNFADIIKS